MQGTPPDESTDLQGSLDYWLGELEKECCEPVGPKPYRGSVMDAMETQVLLSSDDEEFSPAPSLCAAVTIDPPASQPEVDPAPLAPQLQVEFVPLVSQPLLLAIEDKQPEFAAVPVSALESTKVPALLRGAPLASQLLVDLSFEDDAVSDDAECMMLPEGTHLQPEGVPEMAGVMDALPEDVL